MRPRAATATDVVLVGVAHQLRVVVPCNGRHAGKVVGAPLAAGEAKDLLPPGDVERLAEGGVLVGKKGSAEGKVANCGWVWRPLGWTSKSGDKATDRNWKGAKKKGRPRSQLAAAVNELRRRDDTTPLERARTRERGEEQSQVERKAGVTEG